MVKGVESRQTNVGDFFLIESNCRVRRQSIARRTNGHSGRAARQRQRPSDSQYRYGFRPTLSLRISLAMRHDGDFPFHPHLNVPLYTNDGRNAAFERTAQPVSQCPLWVISERGSRSDQCPHYPRKRTFVRHNSFKRIGDDPYADDPDGTPYLGTPNFNLNHPAPSSLTVKEYLRPPNKQQTNRTFRFH